MNDLEPLLSLAHEAVDLARGRFLSKPRVISLKTDRDMVTEIDLAIEADVRRFLAERAPEVGFLGEEGGIQGQDSELTWALDPIDGTANFVHGLPLCAVSLGLIKNQRQVLGVIDLPSFGLRYAGTDAHGSTGDGERLAVRDSTNLSEAIIAIGDYAVGDDAPHKNRMRFAITEALAERVQRVRMFGSAAIDLAWVAAGRLDACVMLSNNPWDTSAGVVIAREAGARTMDLDGTDHTVGSKATIATAPGIADELIDLLQAAMKKQPTST